MPKRPSLNADSIDKPKPYLDRLPVALFTAFSTNNRINRYLIDNLPPAAWTSGGGFEPYRPFPRSA